MTSPAFSGFVSAAAAVGLQTVLVDPSKQKQLRGLYPNTKYPGQSQFQPFLAQVTLEEHHHDEVEITRHPVEYNAAITDHAYMLPAELTLKILCSNSPTNKADGMISLAVTAASIITGQSGPAVGFGIGQAAQSVLGGQSQDQAPAMYERLLELKSNRVLCDIVTGKRQYQDMLMQSISVITNNEMENALIATCRFKQVILTHTQVVSITTDAGKHADPQQTLPTTDRGTQSLTPGTNYRP